MMNSRLKLLLIASDLSDGGGVNRVISNLAQILVELPDVQVDLLHVGEFKGCNYPLPASVNIIRGCGFSRVRPLNLLIDLLRLRRRRYDYVVSFWTQENIVASLAMIASRGRLILCEHFCHDQSTRAASVARRCVYRLAHKVLVLNGQELHYYRRFLKRVELVSNPVIRAGETTFDYQAKQNLIVGVGHLIARKGFEYFIGACVRARIAEAGWRAVIIGEGERKGALEALIRQHGAGDYIELLPPTQTIEEWYRLAKVIVAPSLSEVFSMVIPEAMAYGVVPIAFDADGPSEILRRHRTHLVPTGDEERLAVALGTVIRDPELEPKARSFRDEAIDRYSHTAIAREWRRLLWCA
jgi:glycosyltransferase involved in cell wall biosynthesis